MYQFKIKDYTVNICQDIYEWGREFYGIPDNAELDNIEELTSTSMGFSMLEEKEVWVYIPKGNMKECYRSTIAHEVGHIIEGGFKKNPAPRMMKLHEKKAEHYEQYFNLVMEIINHVECNLSNEA
jgi:hypothetical protein